LDLTVYRAILLWVIPKPDETTHMVGNTEQSIIDSFRPDSPVGTEFLRLYHNVVKKVHVQGSRSLLVTSATIGEGKSTVASFLALTLATIKKKVLLVDADLRLPRLHKLFNHYLEEGVTEVIDGTIPLSQALKPTKHANLTLLTAGRLTRTPSDYFEAGNVGRILTGVGPRFDFVIVDSAPVLPVVDPLVLAQSVSGVLLVVKAGVTHRDLVKQAVEVMQQAGTPVLGILLNNVKEVLPYHYSHRYSYQYYHAVDNGLSPEELGKKGNRP
jgi:capsular exopolysaccharide synthesis family protein